MVRVFIFWALMILLAQLLHAEPSYSVQSNEINGASSVVVTNCTDIG